MQVTSSAESVQRLSAYEATQLLSQHLRNLLTCGFHEFQLLLSDFLLYVRDEQRGGVTQWTIRDTRDAGVCIGERLSLRHAAADDAAGAVVSCLLNRGVELASIVEELRRHGAGAAGPTLQPTPIQARAPRCRISRRHP